MKKITLIIQVQKLLLAIALLYLLIAYKDIKVGFTHGLSQQNKSSQVSKFKELYNELPIPFLMIVKIN